MVPPGCQTCAFSPLTTTPRRPASKGRSLQVPSAVNRKLNTVDKDYKKTWFGQGYFKEDEEFGSANIYQNIEKKKLLSSVEELGLLTALEKAGVSLTKIEESGILSTAEDLGLLSLAEGALQSDPGYLASLSIPLGVAAILALVLIPGDNTIEVILKLIVAGGLFSGATAFLVGGFFVSYLQEDE